MLDLSFEELIAMSAGISLVACASITGCFYVCSKVIKRRYPETETLSPEFSISSQSSEEMERRLSVGASMNSSPKRENDVEIPSCSTIQDHRKAVTFAYTANQLGYKYDEYLDNGSSSKHTVRL